jgi:hypothetical protein
LVVVMIAVVEYAATGYDEERRSARDREEQRDEEDCERNHLDSKHAPRLLPKV